MITPEDRENLHETLSELPEEFIYPWMDPMYGEATQGDPRVHKPSLSDMLEIDECNLRKGEG